MSTDYRDGYDAEDFDGDPIDQWFPKRGQCQICGVPGADQRHRRIEAIADLFGAGESEEDIAAEMEVPVEAVRECVRWAAEHPNGLESP
jgi:uncharacterized protein (DUF433 family)